MTTDTTMTDVDTSSKVDECRKVLGQLAEALDRDGVRWRGKPAANPIMDGCHMIRALAAERDELERLARRMLEAIDAGAVDSQEIDIGDPDIPPHKFHEEWAHHAKRLTAYQREGE